MMPVTGLIKEFGAVMQASEDLRREMYNINNHMVARDPILVIQGYQQAKSTFRRLKQAMTELDRAIENIKEHVPDEIPAYETRQS